MTTKKATTKGKVKGSKGAVETGRSAAAARAIDSLVKTAGMDFITDMVVDAVSDASLRLGIEAPSEWIRDGDTQALARWLAKVPDTFSLRDAQPAADGMTLSVTLTPGFFSDHNTTPEAVEAFRKDAELFARLIEEPEGTGPFSCFMEDAFTRFLSEHVGVRFTQPEILRVFYPLVMACASGNEAGIGSDFFTVAVESLTPDALRERVRAQVYGAEEKRGE